MLLLICFYPLDGKPGILSYIHLHTPNMKSLALSQYSVNGAPPTGQKILDT